MAELYKKQTDNQKNEGFRCWVSSCNYKTHHGTSAVYTNRADLKKYIKKKAKDGFRYDKLLIINRGCGIPTYQVWIVKGNDSWEA